MLNFANFTLFSKVVQIMASCERVLKKLVDDKLLRHRIGLRLFLNIDMNPLIVLAFLDTAQQHTVHGCTMYCVNNAIEARRHDL